MDSAIGFFAGATLVVLGTVSANIEGIESKPSKLSLSDKGRVEGDIVANEVLIAGTVVGSITASGKVGLLDGAVVHSDIRAKKLVKHDVALHIGSYTPGK